MLGRYGLGIVLSLSCMLAGSASDAWAAEMLVRKTAETFDETAWPNSDWNRAAGSSRVVTEHAPEAPAGKSLRIDVQFSGKGFEWFGVGPAKPLVIPGDLKTVTLHYQIGDKRFPLALKFQDGWGRGEAGSTKLEWALPDKESGKWLKASFTVPADWVRPISIVGFATHNWSAQNQALQTSFWTDHLEVETDLGQVDPQTGRLTTWKPEANPRDPAKALTASPATPLVRVDLETARVSHVFVDQSPVALIRLRNWKPGALQGTLRTEIGDADGKVLDRRQQPIAVDSTTTVELDLKAQACGLYTLRTSVELADGTRQTGALTCARLPRQPVLSREQRLRSPYGVNTNGGKSNLRLEPFRQAGIVWFRDYAFSLEWLERAKGEDHRYAGWPWFPSIVRRYQEADAMVLACLMRSIRAPELRDGKPAGRLGPDRKWMREVASAVLAFPEITHWELDNEYDLNRGHFEAEEAVQWKNYREFHRRFAEMLDILGSGELTAVEQGPAGMWPDRDARFVRSGDFDKIGVVNSHHYCGAEAPERNIANWNTELAGDFRAQPPMLFADRLREIKQAARLDGKPRQSWLTEFGWDTLAGPKVTPYQQAVYLARSWMLALAAGTDKCFWFYDYDAPEPKQFFDGCGLLAADGSPKLALCALAGLTARLPNPEYVGSITAGPGTWGAVFRSGKDLVAALWSVDSEEGPKVTFRARELYDHLGNRLNGTSVQLRRAPVYAVGLDPQDTWLRQTAYELTTPTVIGAVAGDPVTPVVEIRNQRAQPIHAQLRLQLPAGWKAEQVAWTANVAPGQTQQVSTPFEVPLAQPRGSQEALLTISEEGLEKRLPLRLLIQSGLALEVSPLRGAPGPTQFTVKVSNRSAQTFDAALELRLPRSWKTETPQLPLRELKPSEVRELTCQVTWSTRWQPGEAAAVQLDARGQKVTRPIVPGRLRLPRAKQITIDGRGDDWPSDAQLPSWLTATTWGEPDAHVSLAWSPEGLYGLVEVPVADVANPDPRNFWVGNCLELFLDCRDRKGSRSFERGDHQFWFVPLVAERRVYAGQWKRADEITETRYDLRNVQGVAAVKGQGYVMEFLLPAAELQGFAPRAGASLGLNLNLTIQGGEVKRELYWPAAKDKNIATQPGLWGSVELVE
jgi:hypothetical protein